jgi:membrane protein
MPNLWTLGGLSLPDLLRRTARESWQDAVFGQGGRMAFYHFLAIFPSLLVFLALTEHIPHLGEHMKNAFQNLSGEVLPDQASQLLLQTVNQLNERPLSALQFLSVCAGGSWGALNSTWAMVWGLNKAYELEEHRPWWKVAFVVAGLTVSLATCGSLAVFLIFCGTRLQTHPNPAAVAIRLFEWIVLSGLLLFSFALLYRFAPNLRDHEWRWSTPGALCALVIWIGSTVGARLYFRHVNDYSRSYGHLNGVVMLLLWLYVTNGAILIGGEMNSEIEKAAAKQTAHQQDRSGS